MDAVRFGRALGMGARQAAKAAAMAVDAASTPNPSPVAPRGATCPEPSKAAQAGARVASTAAQTRVRVEHARTGVSRGGKRFGEAVWGPFIRLSGVLWLEVMGVFFGLFVLTAGMNVWKLRANVHDLGTNHSAHQHLLFSVAMFIVFGYFCVSSFVRANRRSRPSR